MEFLAGLYTLLLVTICLLLAVLMVLACTACGAKANDGASGDMRTLTDGKNRTVEVPKQVERVVCVGVGALRYSCYVGAADRAVGVEDYETKAGMSRLYNYVNFDKFKDLPVTGTNGEPYVEQIIDVAPQVIVMSAYASCDADELSAKTGIPVFVVPGSDTTLDDAAYETIRLLGELYGLETRAQELTKYLKGIQTDLDTRTAKIADDQKPSVYVGGVSFKGQHGFEGTEAGYGPYFGHSYGHSLGLEIHEAPNCTPRNENPIPAGAVCSAEPGIYIPGKFGVRIEDVVIFREGGCEVITHSPKELTIL